jgi:hypothetical protein
LRETARGVVHEVPWDAEANIGFSGRPTELVRILEDLARRGLVTRSETVHPFDSSEYVVIWRPIASVPPEGDP